MGDAGAIHRRRGYAGGAATKLMREHRVLVTHFRVSHGTIPPASSSLSFSSGMNALQKGVSHALHHPGLWSHRFKFRTGLCSGASVDVRFEFAVDAVEWVDPDL